MVLLLATTVFGAEASVAASLESLLMPGKVARAHAEIEENCSGCHDRSDRNRQSSLCLACHKDVAASVAQKRGYHGKLPNITTAQCRACHSDHLGRDADIVRFTPATFDHRYTNFTLEGAHTTLNCVSCHKRGDKFARAPSTCIACHRKDDAHRGQLSDKCDSCHNKQTWAGARFDHDSTKFPLRDAHRDLRCGACHLAGKYQNTPTRCASCHQPDDVHQGARGDKCADCHTTVSWKDATFDHGKETGFALLGRHSGLQCGACHRSGNFKDKLPKDCAGCHRADDAHALRFGADCANCHNNDSWRKVSYDHTLRAKFELRGAHAKLECHSCHTANVKQQKLGHDCISCHRADDVHGAALTAGCDSCHNDTRWKSDIRFDHDLTAYPLVGLHAVVGCAQCHATKAFKGAPQQCLGCHAHNDVHKGGLGKDCAACHSPNGWKIWDFDHAQTGFALSGAHSKLKCADCHRQPAGKVKLPQDCASCHRKDDVHLGQYGTQCQRCHTTLTFQGARIQ